MEAILHWLAGTMLPIIIVGFGIALLSAVSVVASRYKKIPPGEVGIFYGRKYKSPDPKDPNKTIIRGFRVIASGGAIQMPLVEKFDHMSTAAFQIEISESKIPNKDNVFLNVEGVATCKISTEFQDLVNAAEAFLGKKPDEIRQMVHHILQGHLRSIIGNLDIDEILRKRDEFNKKVIAESEVELQHMGVKIYNLVITDVKDMEGFIEALGKKAVAETKRDATIKVATAEKEASIQVSNAAMEAATVKANNEATIAEAEKNRDVKKAKFQAEAETERAKAEKAKDIALADQDKILLVKEADRDAAEKEAQTKVQEKEAERKEQELFATVVKPAEAQKKATIIDAEAAEQKMIIEARADQQKNIIGAEGQAKAMERNAEAKQKATTAEGLGEAAKTKATLEAQATGQAAIIKEQLMAEATGNAAKVELKLLAEAKGTKELAESLKQMSEQAQLILILDRLPKLIEELGEAGSKIAEAIFKSIAMPLGNIDNLSIVDLGGSGRGLDQIGSIVPSIAAKFFAGLKAAGIDATPILAKLGLNTADLENMLAKILPGLFSHKPAGEKLQAVTVEVKSDIPPKNPEEARDDASVDNPEKLAEKRHGKKS